MIVLSIQTAQNDVFRTDLLSEAIKDHHLRTAAAESGQAE